MAYATDAARWRALIVRDANANGHFIYSVKSTSIYCRPTCPGRLARRANVDFHATPIEAEAAGFRACKRCKPNTILEDPQKRAVEKACALIKKALKNEDASALRLQDLAKKVNLTPRYFHKIFKDKTGLTPKEYAKKAIDRSSLSTTPVSTTTTETSAQSWDWESFDFNGLLDSGYDSAPLNMDDFPMPQGPSEIDSALEFDVTSLLQPLDGVYEPAQNLSWQYDSENHTGDPFQQVSMGFHYDKKVMPSISTLELDACDNSTGMLQT
ncbi:dna repair and transcription factor [Stemphylium lycopersici]|nr:dna repair and transcription factor [Stemphylium lycopersici]RAR08598.1 dna repair and transcription factor [Stemphylium lycopersici]